MLEVRRALLHPIGGRHLLGLLGVHCPSIVSYRHHIRIIILLPQLSNKRRPHPLHDLLRVVTELRYQRPRHILMRPVAFHRLCRHARLHLVRVKVRCTILLGGTRMVSFGDGHHNRLIT